MTDERKMEIIKLIEEDNTWDITKKEVKEFYGLLTDDEKKYVREKCNENRRNRIAKQELEKDMKLRDGQYDKIFQMQRIVNMFKNKDIYSEDFMLKTCEEFALNFLVEKEPIIVHAKGIGTFYECTDCSCGIKKYQPFCANCGLLFKWE